MFTRLISIAAKRAAGYPRAMHSKYCRYSILTVIALLASPVRAQDNPLNDPDLKEMLKEAEKIQKEAGELQKQNPTSPDTKKKLAEMEAQAKEEEARQEQEEKREKEKLQAALKKQLDAPGPVVLPDWTPATPQFKAADKPAKKIVDDEVRILQTGTSSLTPKELADSWEAAAVAAKNLNHGRNNISVNGKLTTIMFLSTRSEPVERVELEASREPDGKITQVEISSPLPKPDIDSE
jgi:sarcosine oxidase gamma subunit